MCVQTLSVNNIMDIYTSNIIYIYIHTCVHTLSVNNIIDIYISNIKYIHTYIRVYIH